MNKYVIAKRHMKHIYRLARKRIRYNHYKKRKIYWVTMRFKWNELELKDDIGTILPIDKEILDNGL